MKKNINNAITTLKNKQSYAAYTAALTACASSASKLLTYIESRNAIEDGDVSGYYGCSAEAAFFKTNIDFVNERVEKAYRIFFHKLVKFSSVHTACMGEHIIGYITPDNKEDLYHYAHSLCDFDAVE